MGLEMGDTLLYDFMHCITAVLPKCLMDCFFSPMILEGTTIYMFF